VVPPGERQKLVIEPFLLPGSVQMLQKIDFMNTIVAFKDLLDQSVLHKMLPRHDDAIR